jgi:hypothetical protein
VVTLTTRVAGYTAATFSNDYVQASFKQGVAAALGVSASAVTITSYYDSAARRSLLDAALTVAFTVLYPSLAAADAGAASLNAAVANGSLANQLRVAGLAQLASITAGAPAGTVQAVPTPPASDGSNVALIGGVAGGAGGGGVLIIALVVMCVCMRRRRAQATLPAKPEPSSFVVVTAAAAAPQPFKAAAAPAGEPEACAAEPALEAPAAAI